MIEHNHSASAGTKHSMNFFYCLSRFRRVMQNPVGVNQIKTLIFKVEVLSISRFECSWQIEQLKPFTRQLNRRVGEIDSSVIRARFGKLRPVCSQATANFQHLQATGAGKIGRYWDVPLCSVAMRFDQFVESARPRASIGKLYTAGIGLPKSADSFLELCLLFVLQILLHSEESIPFAFC